MRAAKYVRRHRVAGHVSDLVHHRCSFVMPGSGRLLPWELVEVLAHERGASRSFSLLYPRGVVQTPAVKKLVAFLVAEARRADVR